MHRKDILELWTMKTKICFKGIILSHPNKGLNLQITKKMVNDFPFTILLSSPFISHTVRLFIKGSVACTKAPTIKISPTTAGQLPAN